jgi:hypothetical protein
MPNSRHRFHIVDEPGIAGQQRGILLAGIPRADPAVRCFLFGNEADP